MKLTQAIIDDPYTIRAKRAKVANRVLTIELASGVEICLPIAMLAGPFAAASKTQLANVVTLYDGSWLWWEDLDEGFVLDEVLPGMLGIKPASLLARLTRGRSTPKKAAAARLNGRLGGRPKKVPQRKSPAT